VFPNSIIYFSLAYVRGTCSGAGIGTDAAGPPGGSVLVVAGGAGVMWCEATSPACNKQRALVVIEPVALLATCTLSELLRGLGEAFYPLYSM
jgi:hypothetical protein